jgi:hypothetical protein
MGQGREDNIQISFTLFGLPGRFTIKLEPLIPQMALEIMG